MDRVFFALSDPVRRRILEELDEQPKLVSELAAAAVSLKVFSTAPKADVGMTKAR